jgi:FAD/FMN-containing dehydrogenase
MSIDAASDGFYHPANEEDLIDLVLRAGRHNRKLRVRGAEHSVAQAIHTDPPTGIAAPAGDLDPTGADDVDPRAHSQVDAPGAGVVGAPESNFNVRLDKYADYTVVPDEDHLVCVQAGMHLGEVPGEVPLECSLLWRLWSEHGWMLSDTGGISRQTVSGFVATGSAGGSVQFSANQNLHSFRLIDAAGDTHDVVVPPQPAAAATAADPAFAMAPHLGLVGVVSTITFRCVDTFTISGEQAITNRANCEINLFGADDDQRPSLACFLRKTQFARVEWWPQRDCERMVVWKAWKAAPKVGFRPQPYRQFTAHPGVAEFVICILFTLLGNLDHPSAAKAKLGPVFDDVTLGVAEKIRAAARLLGAPGHLLAHFVGDVLRIGVDRALDDLEHLELGPFILEKLPDFFPKLLDEFLPFDKPVQPDGKGGPQLFQDWAWSGLPMDNEASDVEIPVQFTEIWVPLSEAETVMRLLDNHFQAGPDGPEAYARTGTFAFELYAAPPSSFWLNPAYADHADDTDAWRDGAFRVDIYWFAYNAADPATSFYPQFWKLLSGAGIPLRFHWGKFLPEADDEYGGAAFLKRQYPRWECFLKLRAERDPGGIFLNDYWRAHLGLDAGAPPPEPAGGAA